jgi:broad specificity phosphatase PhoE
MLVRHAQASAGDDDYDQLSDLGLRQARVLGEHWARLGFCPDTVYLGSLKRHRQTVEEVAGAFAEQGLEWPEGRVLEHFDEHAGMTVVEGAMPILAESDPVVATGMREMEEHPERRVRTYFRIFRHVTRLWVRGELSGMVPEEPWAEFRRRVSHGLAEVADAGAPLAVVFTSAGAVASAVGESLDLGEERTLELSWSVQNTGLSELLVWPSRRTLRVFNSLPHLLDEGLITWV